MSNMGAQLASMAQANQSAQADPRAYPGAFLVARGWNQAGLTDNNQVGLNESSYPGVAEIFAGAAGANSQSPIRKLFSEMINKGDAWANTMGAAKDAAKAIAAEHAPKAASSAASEIAQHVNVSESMSGVGATTSSSGESNNSSGSSGSGSNRAFSAVGSDFADSGAAFVGNVSQSQLGSLSPKATPGKGESRDAGKGVR